MPSTLDERYRYGAHVHRIQVTAGAGTRFPVYTRDGLLRAEYGVENDTYYYLGTQWVARKRSGLRPDLIFLSGFEALLPRALAKRLVEALVGLKSGGESVTWFLTDHLGSNIATVDAAGAVIERSQFAPYGERWGKVAERGPGFTGHYEDQSTLTYMKARYYGGIVGRFLSPDPVLTDTADGGNFNRYWYANNNPQKFVDPDGRAAVIKFRNGAKVRDAVRTFVYLSRSPSAVAEMRQVVGSKQTYTIVFDRSPATEMEYNPDTRAILVNPTAGLVVRSTGKVQSPAVGIAHEISHAAEHDRLGSDGYSATTEAPLTIIDGPDGIPTFAWGVSPEEERATRVESLVAEELGEAVRRNYRDEAGSVTTCGPTSTKPC